MKKIMITFALLVVPVASAADRYGVNDGSGGGNGGVFDLLGGLFAVVFSYWFIVDSFKKRKERRAAGQKIERGEFITDGVIPVLGYIIISFILIVPIMFIVKLFGGVALVKSSFFIIWFLSFGVVSFLRQT